LSKFSSQNIIILLKTLVYIEDKREPN